MATKPPTRDQLMALPSMANSLSSLPQATNIHSLALHANFTTTIQHTAHSAHKLQRALAVNAARQGQPQAAHTHTSSSSSSSSDDGQITIRKKAKFTV